MADIPIGKCVDLKPYYENLSRREFIRMTGAGAATALGLDTFIERSYGAEPNGEPLVHTRDPEGRPAKVRIVEPERRRRIMAYKHLDVDPICRHPKVDGVSMDRQSDDPTDLSISIDVVEPPANTDLPSQASTLGRRAIRKTNAGRRRRGQSPLKPVPFHYSEVKRGEPIQRDLEGGSPLDQNGSFVGTAGLVCSSPIGGDVLLTAEHIDPDQDGLSYNGHSLNEVLGSTEVEDAAIYDIPSAANWDPINIQLLGDVQGYWTFQGLQDATDYWWEKFDAESYGGYSGPLEGTFVGTQRHSSPTDPELGHEARLHEDPVYYGDSGSPWVGNDNYLVGLTSYSDPTWERVRTVTNVAGIIFNNLNCSLYSSGNAPTK